MQTSSNLTRSLIALAFATVAGFASIAMADTKSEKLGNPTGTQFQAACPPGQLMIGWVYNYGDTLMDIGPACQGLVNGQLSGAPVASPKTIKGSEAGSVGSDQYGCPAQYGAVEKITVAMTSDLRILSFRATCRNLQGSGKGGSSLSAPMKTTGAVAKASGSTVGCDTGAHATGFYGSFVEGGPRPGIQSLGLLCRADGDTGAPPPPPPQNADNGDDQGDGDQANIDDGDNGNSNGNGDGNGNGNGITINGLPFQIQINLGPGQNGVNFGPKGKVRFADDDTTIYADKGNTEIGYLNKGDKVLVIGCEKKGKGWCQIAKPTPGLVWGGDLQ